MNLRPYQLSAASAVESEWDSGRQRTLVVMPTGTGKTILFAKVVCNAVAQGARCLILAHREELLSQAADKIAAATGLGCAREKGEDTSVGEFFRVVVGSVQTLMREKRLARFKPDHFDVIVVDEAHHALADSYQRVLAYFSEARVLGVTATPDRGDMKNLGAYFDSLAYEYTLPQAIKDGYLCPIQALTIPIKIDLSQVGVRGGDFQADEVGSALDPYLGQIADEMAQHCRDRRTVVFLPLIATSQKFRGLLAERGFRAAEVNGQSTDRAQILADFAEGRYDVLCNSMLLTEGWDCPPVDCVVCLRPTKVRSLYCQIVGRGTRIHPGKKNLLLLDFLWMSERHDLCRPASLIAHDKMVADKMTEAINAAGCPVDISEAEKSAESEVVSEREAALARSLAAMRNRKRKLVDPVQYIYSVHDEGLAAYEPSFGWEAGPPTPDQKKRLETNGIFPDEIQTAGEAERLLQSIAERRRAGLATPKQIRFLESKGFQQVGTWGFDDARRVIDCVAANGWRVPSEIDPEKYRPAAPQPQAPEPQHQSAVVGYDELF